MWYYITRGVSMGGGLLLYIPQLSIPMFAFLIDGGGGSYNFTPSPPRISAHNYDTNTYVTWH